MKSLSSSEARTQFSNVVDWAQFEPVSIERHGETQAVVISLAEYTRMQEALEEQEDLAAFDAALTEGGDPIAWEQALVDLGWA